ncbi:MAG: hypothetical protein JXA54_11305 [Candidatus Heimdallarchaeota archaeon]|nr:hypothetical protein [Candidatus Heimdallarchaeota archaeon]
MNELYPLLEGVKRNLKENTSTITATGRYFIENRTFIKTQGWLEYFVITVSNPDVEITIKVDNDDILKGITPNDLYTEGRDAENPTGLWLSEYDDDNSKYTVIYADTCGFNQQISFETSYSSYNILSYRISVLEITNETLLKNSLSDILGGSKTVTTLQERFNR